jgi:hypothetical protein
MPSLDEMRMSTVVWHLTQPQQQSEPQPTPEPQSEPEPTSELDGLSADELYLKLSEAAGMPEYDGLLKRYIAAAESEDGTQDGDGFWRPHKADDGLEWPQEGEPVPGTKLA